MENLWWLLLTRHAFQRIYDLEEKNKVRDTAQAPALLKAIKQQTEIEKGLSKT